MIFLLPNFLQQKNLKFQSFNQKDCQIIGSSKDSKNIN